MKIDRNLFRDPATMTFPSRLQEQTFYDLDQPLPQEVAELPKDFPKGFPHSKRVGNYLLGKSLGEGSFAKVKESVHAPSGEKVAIKVIDKKKAKEDAYVRKNMRREGKLLQTIRHCNVIQLYEIMETENSYYLVTELCKGGDLMDHICAKKKLEEKETKKYIRQIISAVHYLHSAGILHRDLKVENLMLDENKDIKIIDFGLSNAVRVSQMKEGSVIQEFCVTQCGSPAYAAPELLGNKKYGPKVDIWSIGINMYAMLTGNLPFTVEPFNIKSLHQKMLAGDMNALPDNLSKDGRDFLRKLLTPDPEQRISLQEAMHHPWITDARNRPMEPAPFPNKLNADDLNQDILKHMSQNLDHRLGETIRLITSNIPSNATSTYHMFHRKLSRYNAEMRVQGKVAANEAQLISSSRSTQNTSGYASRDDVIDLVPLHNTFNKEVNANKTADVTKKCEPVVVITEDKKNQSPRLSVTSPVRLTQRHARQITFHGDHMHVDIHGNNIQGIRSKQSTNQRPATTNDNTDASGDVQIFHLAKDFSKKPFHTNVWTNPKGKLFSTNETKISEESESPCPERLRYSHQPDLPAIAEKSSPRELGRPKNPTKTLMSPLMSRRTSRHRKPRSNYTFRPRGAFSANRVSVEDADNIQTKRGTDYVTDNKTGGQASLGSTESNADHKSICSGPGGHTNEAPVPTEQNGSMSDPIPQRTRHSTHISFKVTGHLKNKNNNAINGKSDPYEYYSYKPGRKLPVSVSASLNTKGSESPDLKTKKPVSVVYPTYHKPQRGRSFNIYTRNHLLSNAEELNVTGEKTGLNGTRLSAMTVDGSVSNPLSLSILPDKNPPTVKTHVINTNVSHITEEVVQGKQDKSTKASSEHDERRLLLPEISPPLLNTKH